MIKKTMSIILAMLVILSAASLTMFTASAEEATEVVATADEATTDEAKIVISDEPKVPAYSVDGMVIGYIGDVNDDDKINVKDATAIQKCTARIITFSLKSQMLADVDNNGKVNVRDATTLQKYLASFEVESLIWHLVYETGTHVHDYMELVVEAKCETEGYTYFSCICGDERKENIVEAKGHDYDVKQVKATCVDDGYTLYDCKNCYHSYKDNVVKATGKHDFKKDGVCKVCKERYLEYPISRLGDYIKKNGEYVKEMDSYCLDVDTGYESDGYGVFYNEKEKSIILTYAVAFEDGVDVISIGFSAEEEDFSFYMSSQGYFEAIGTCNRESYSLELDSISDIEYYYYIDEIPEDECLEYTLIFIDAALAIYEEQGTAFPVTIRDLGFDNFVIE